LHTGRTTPGAGERSSHGQPIVGIDEKWLKEIGVADELFNGATLWHPIGEAPRGVRQFAVEVSRPGVSTSRRSCETAV
jgi:hypothetical protein